MVFLDSFAMSIPKARQGPSPPTVEQILEDLAAASDEDVVFKSPVHVVVERETQTRNASGHSREGKFGFCCFVMNFSVSLCVKLFRKMGRNPDLTAKIPRNSRCTTAHPPNYVDRKSTGDELAPQVKGTSDFLVAMSMRRCYQDVLF